MFIQAESGEVYYERKGDSVGTPLVGVHGGPGFTSYYLEPLYDLSEQLPVVLYDQAGCGRSRRGGARKVFSILGFVEELESLRESCGIERMHLLGHSFGGLIIGEYALAYPTRVASLTFACVSIDIPSWIRDGERLVSGLSLLDKMILREGARTGVTSSPEYLRALDRYYKKHIYGCDDLPELLTRSVAESDSQTYQTVWGVNELLVTGVVRDYDFSPRLPLLQGPTLFTCGRFDEATPEAHERFASLVPGAKCRVFERSAHHPQITEREDFLAMMSSFLREVE